MDELITPRLKRPGGEVVVLLFSGGRDSTLAAVRLAARFSQVKLLTITTDNLVGMASVERRVAELESKLSIPMEWLTVTPPENFSRVLRREEENCLTCHHAQLVLGVAAARHFHTPNLAVGYSGYQSHWPEQTPQSVEMLRTVLGSFRLNLELPVYDLESKEAAKNELRTLGLSPAAREQKCLAQLIARKLNDEEMANAVKSWAKILDTEIRNLKALDISFNQGAASKER